MPLNKKNCRVQENPSLYRNNNSRVWPSNGQCWLKNFDGNAGHRVQRYRPLLLLGCHDGHDEWRRAFKYLILVFAHSYSFQHGRGRFESVDAYIILSQDAAFVLLSRCSQEWRRQHRFWKRAADVVGRCVGDPSWTHDQGSNMARRRYRRNKQNSLVEHKAAQAKKKTAEREAKRGSISWCCCWFPHIHPDSYIQEI